jgi:hypothetical protein
MPKTHENFFVAQAKKKEAFSGFFFFVLIMSRNSKKMGLAWSTMLSMLLVFQCWIEVLCFCWGVTGVGET